MDTQRTSATQHPKIGAINGFRGLAILLVVVHHLFIPYFSNTPAALPLSWQHGLIAILVRNAALGVDVFFVLSGFVLYLPYRAGSRQFLSRADVKTFYKHRANRLLPLYFIVVLIGLIFHTQNPIGSLKWYAEGIGLVTGLFDFSPHGFMPPSNIVLWSVGVEIWFSVLFPFFVIGIIRLGIWQIFFATFFICLAFNVCGLLIPVERVGHFAPFTMGVLGKAYEFLLGMLACHLFVSRFEVPSSKKNWYGAVAGLSAAICAALVVAHDALPVYWAPRGGVASIRVHFHHIYVHRSARSPRFAKTI